MKIEIFPDISYLSDKFRAVLLDAFGVFWGGNEFGLLPGAKEMMEKIVLDGKIVGILSNSTQVLSKEIEKLKLSGLVQGKHFHFLITSGEIVRNIFIHKQIPFQTPRNQFCLFGSDHPKFPSHKSLFFETTYQQTDNLHEADFIYVTTPHINGENQLDPKIFYEKIKTIPRNIPMVCANPDLFAQEGIPQKIVVRQGSIAKMYEELGGKVFYIGKPYTLAYSSAMQQFNHYDVVKPSDILMVGDTPETDIRGARKFGMLSTLILKTGIMSERISQKGLEQSIHELPDSDFPNYFIEKLSTINVNI